MALIPSNIGLANLEMPSSEAEMVTTIARALASRLPVWKIRKTAARPRRKSAHWPPTFSKR